MSHQKIQPPHLETAPRRFGQQHDAQFCDWHHAYLEAAGIDLCHADRCVLRDWLPGQDQTALALDGRWTLQEAMTAVGRDNWDILKDHPADVYTQLERLAELKTQPETQFLLKGASWHELTAALRRTESDRPPRNSLSGGPSTEMEELECTILNTLTRAVQDIEVAGHDHDTLFRTLFKFLGVEREEDKMLVGLLMVNFLHVRLVADTAFQPNLDDLKTRVELLHKLTGKVQSLYGDVKRQLGLEDWQLDVALRTLHGQVIDSVPENLWEGRRGKGS